MLGPSGLTHVLGQVRCQYGFCTCMIIWRWNLCVQDAAVRVGEAIGKACIEKGISKVSFDRGGFVYHGRIKALADAAREAGLDF